MTYVSPDTPYMKLLAPFLVSARAAVLRYSRLRKAKKQKLAIDAWGADDSTPEIRAAYKPLEDFIERNIDPKYLDLYPQPHWPWKIRVARSALHAQTMRPRADGLRRLARSILVAEYMVDEWAEYFRGKTEEQLDEIAASFRFENCLKRDTLNTILTSTLT